MKDECERYRTLGRRIHMQEKQVQRQGGRANSAKSGTEHIL